jgi:hypothetical protein
MDNWLVNVCVYTLTAYIETKSIVETQRRFRSEFNVEKHGQIPSRNTILNWFNKFNAAGSVMSSFTSSGSSVHTPANIERVRLAVQRSPTRSALQHAAALHLSNRTICRILREDLGLHPYKIQLAQELRQQDRDSRLHFATEFSAVLQENDNALNDLLTRHIFT